MITLSLRIFHSDSIALRAARIMMKHLYIKLIFTFMCHYIILRIYCINYKISLKLSQLYIGDLMEVINRYLCITIETMIYKLWSEL